MNLQSDQCYLCIHIWPVQDVASSLFALFNSRVAFMNSVQHIGSQSFWNNHFVTSNLGNCVSFMDFFFETPIWSCISRHFKFVVRSSLPRSAVQLSEELDLLLLLLETLSIFALKLGGWLSIKYIFAVARLV